MCPFSGLSWIGPSSSWNIRSARSWETPSQSKGRHHLAGACFDKIQNPNRGHHLSHRGIGACPSGAPQHPPVAMAVVVAMAGMIFPAMSLALSLSTSWIR